MRVMGALLLTVASAPAQDDLFNTDMYVSPAEGETASKGTFTVFHQGMGEMPTSGYFKRHEPGEVAEYHLFVPDGLSSKKRYPLLIVYHGGKDGGSGKGLCRSMSRLSTKKHPVIVLSPNMYTLDAYNELIAEGKVPIDTRRVMVFGFSSGGMGVRSAMAEYVRTEGRFKPATLVCASTTASLGRAKYPPVPYIVMAGQKETAEFIRHPALKNRRSTCRKHAAVMQQVIEETRYIEMKGHGHTSGKPEHRAVLLNLLRALSGSDVPFKAGRVRPELEALVARVQDAEWVAVREELKRFDAMEKPPSGYTSLRRKILSAFEKWFRAEAKAVAGLGPKSRTLAITRGLHSHDALTRAADAFADSSKGKVLKRLFEPVKRSKHWPRELEARRRYLEIVGRAPSDRLRQDLEALRAELPDTEFGGNRTKEKLLALQG